MVKTISASLIFLLPDRDLPLLFGRGVRILYTPDKVDIHPLEAKLKSILFMKIRSNLFWVNSIIPLVW